MVTGNSQHVDRTSLFGGGSNGGESSLPIRNRGANLGLDDHDPKRGARHAVGKGEASGGEP